MTDKRRESEEIRRPTPEKIRATRLNSKLTQREAADLIGVDVSAWERFESGTRQIRPRSWVVFLDRLAERARIHAIRLRVEILERDLFAIRCQLVEFDKADY